MIGSALLADRQPKGEGRFGADALIRAWGF